MTLQEAALSLINMDGQIHNVENTMTVQFYYTNFSNQIHSKWIIYVIYDHQRYMKCRKQTIIID
jgi:hypothetical protein